MAVLRLWLTDFRCFEAVEFEPDPSGLTVLQGENGAGKTSLLEAVGWLATQRSFRGAPRDAMVRRGCDRAVVRAETDNGGRSVLVEAELPTRGPARAQVNRQVVRRRTDLAQAVRISVFSPDDLAIVQEGPALRRVYLDDALAGRHPRYEALQTEVERILRQRVAVLRQSGGRTDPEVNSTLDVWDDRLARAGQDLASARAELAAELAPLVTDAYAALAGAVGTPSSVVRLEYRPSWDGTLGDALVAARREDLRRQVTSVGPHRDDLEITIDDRPARTHASQGEQRSVALALRLATHHLARAEHDEPPVLLLDDVFSELDHRRAAALVEQLPPGQVLLTTAVHPPSVVTADRVVEVAGGRLTAVGRPA